MSRKRAMEDAGQPSDNFTGNIPSTGPQTATVQGMDMMPALDSLGGPMLGKAAAEQFERMDKRAQARVLLSKEIPQLVKLALALYHTPGLTKEAKLKLGKYLLAKGKSK